MSLFGFRRPVQPPLPSPAETNPVVPEPATTEHITTTAPPGTTPAGAESPVSLRHTPSDDQEYLWTHLSRIHDLVRAQTARWQSIVAETKPSEWWGMQHVSQNEVNNFLHSGFLSPDNLPADLHGKLAPYWKMADDQAKKVEPSQPEEWSTTPRLRRLELLFCLTEMERDALLLCVLPEVDARYRRLYGLLTDDATRTRPTVELILEMLFAIEPDLKDRWACFSAHSPLRENRLIVVGGGEEDALPLPLRSVGVDDRILAYLFGADQPDDRLSGILQLVPAVGWEDVILPDVETAQLKSIAAWWQEQKINLEKSKVTPDWEGAYARSRAGRTLYLHGPYGSPCLTVAQAICGTTKPHTPLWVADTAAALRSPHGLQAIVDLAIREALLQDAALYWANVEILFPLGADPSAEVAVKPLWEHLVAAVRDFPGLTFLVGETAWEPAGEFGAHTFLRLDLPMPAYELRKAIWQKHLPSNGEFSDREIDRVRTIELLANAFQLTEGQVMNAVALAHDLAAVRNIADPRLEVTDVYDGCRRQAGRRLAGFARRIEPSPGVKFSDLVLPPLNQLQLEELRQRIHLQNRVLTELGFERRLTLGKGLVVLFTGSSGTGKTMAAELLAGEQNVDLYKVDLAAVVSKWVGETEQHLKSIFDQAEGSNAILFFDECDALFAKRGDVKEAHDRWANLEANDLLQRIEQIKCTVILATNLLQLIDPAFIRRIQMIVEFPMPEAKARYKIWMGLFPSHVGRPTDEEIKDLADRFDLSGGSIRNVVMDAAFRAVADQKSGETVVITLRHVVLAIARELMKLGRVLTKGEFGAEYYAIVEKEILGIGGPEVR